MFTTTSIDLVDEGPTLCRPGLIVRGGERCRFRDTRSEFVVDADGSASYPVGPQPTAGGSTGQRGRAPEPVPHPLLCSPDRRCRAAIRA